MSLSPLAAFLLVAALIAALASNPVQAGIGAAIWLVALAAQLAAQAGLFLPELGPPGRPAESAFEEDPRE